MTIPPLKLVQAARPLYDQQLHKLSREEKLSLQGEIRTHEVRSVPLVFFAMLAAVGAFLALCIGGVLCCIDNVVFLSEIFLPFILPGILSLLLIALLLRLAWKEQKLAAQKQQRIAASCYFESLALCRTYKSGAPSVKGLVNFIQSEILPSGFSKRFKFAVLTQAKPSLLTKKIQLTKTPFDETIETAFSHIREGLYLSESEQRDHDKKSDNEANTSPKG